MNKFKKHFTKSLEDLIGKEESAPTYKGRKFSICFKKLAETINLDMDEIKTEIRSNNASKERATKSFSEIISGQSAVKSLEYGPQSGVINEKIINIITKQSEILSDAPLSA